MVSIFGPSYLMILNTLILQTVGQYLFDTTLVTFETCVVWHMEGVSVFSFISLPSVQHSWELKTYKISLFSRVNNEILTVFMVMTNVRCRASLEERFTFSSNPIRSPGLCACGCREWVFFCVLFTHWMCMIEEVR